MVGDDLVDALVDLGLALGGRVGLDHVDELVLSHVLSSWVWAPGSAGTEEGAVRRAQSNRRLPAPSERGRTMRPTGEEKEDREEEVREEGREAGEEPPKREVKAVPKAVPAAAKAAAPVEDGITPYLCCKGAAAALDFYAKAFGAVETLRMQGTDGSIGHAEHPIEGAPIMVSDEWPDGGVFSPQTLGGSPVTVHMYVRERRRARRAGGDGRGDRGPRSEDEPYGDRAATLRDPFGHRWMVATKKEDVSKEEMEVRFGGSYLVT